MGQARRPMKNNGQIVGGDAKMAAKIIPLRRRAHATEQQLAEHFERLALETTTTLVELVATAEAHGLTLPPAVRRAAAMLDGPSVDARFIQEGHGGFDDDLNGAEPEDLAQVLEASNVGPMTIAQLEETVAGLGQDLPRRSPFELRQPINRYLQRVTNLLKQPQPPEIRRRLCSTAGQLAGMAGNVEFDLHRPDKARALYGVARAAAEQAGDPAVSAWVLGNISYLLEQRGELERALEAAQGGVSFASQCTVTTQHVWLALREAELHASLGNLRSMRTALRRADQAMQQARLEERRPGIDFFTEAKLPAYKASCYMLVGQSQPALECSTEALNQLDPSARSRSFVLLDHATILVGLGDAEQACSIATDFLAATPAAEQTPRLVRRVQDFRRTLIPVSTAGAVREFGEALRLWLDDQ
jgi:tetratricopeptide (TPR) repeat protein